MDVSLELHGAPCSASSVDRLPTEILGHIFKLLWLQTKPHPELDIETWPWYLPVHSFSVHLSHVSRRWRLIALDIPLLWSRVDNRVLPRMHTFFQRSRTSPISLCACLTISLRRSSMCLSNNIPLSCHRHIQRLDIRLEATDIFTQHRLSFPAPLLQVLTLQCVVHKDVQITRCPILFQDEILSLKAMALLSIRHWLPGNRFPDLIHLNISYFFIEELSLTLLTRLLANTPRLESLHLGQVWSYALLDLDIAPPTKSVPLPHLRNLSSSCAPLQAMSALISALTLSKDTRIRIHAAPSQQHTTARENLLPSLDFMKPLTSLELAADGSILYLHAESDDALAAVWIQATWDDRESSVWYDWLGHLHEILVLSAVRTFHVSLRDWTVVPPLLERMTALRALGLMALPDDPLHDLMVPTICATLEPKGPVITCPELFTLSFQCNSLLCTGHILRTVAQRSSADCRIAHVIIDKVHIPHTSSTKADQDHTIEVDESKLASLSLYDGELALLSAYVDDLDVGGGQGICRWEQRHGWEFENEHWRLPAGDRPRCVFPWHSVQDE
ncbi:hypothetical protein C8Q74DRAFT_1305200 [Fomes fomentarius]|nr:hypothetical protein C8Q74DRAFT_1305200 [Fomes fomentarius]